MTYETEKEVRRAMLEAEKGSPICDHFKDRSRFVELPCKVGDTVYRLKDGKVTKEQVVEFGISSRGVVLYRTLGYELGYSDYFGNSLFFSKEEAEQALKERESSD